MIAALPKSAPALTILIADDHSVVREFTEAGFPQHRSNKYSTTKGASTFEEALRSSMVTRYVGLILVDLVMPGVKDSKASNCAQRAFQQFQLPLFRSMTTRLRPSGDSEGVIGYIPKSANADEIRRALTRIFEGEVYFPRDLLTRSWPVAAEELRPKFASKGPA